MNIKLLKKYLVVASVSIFLASCDQDKKETQAEMKNALSAQPYIPPSTPPIVLPATLTVKRIAKTYVITGIGLGGSNKVAIINNQVIKPGADIDPGVVLRDVQPTYAVIHYGNKDYLLRPEDLQRELDKKKP